jgi:hypothetical protein
MLRRLKTSYMLDRKIVRVARFEVFVEYGKDLIVENLEFPDTVYHSLKRLEIKFILLIYCSKLTHYMFQICVHTYT